MRIFTLDDYFERYGAKYANQITPEIRENAKLTVDRHNALFTEFGESRPSNSGWRPLTVNHHTPGAKSGSKHITGQANDSADRERDFAIWCVLHQDILQNVGLWMEDPRFTPTWVHLQTVAPLSGNRIFLPYDLNKHPELRPTNEVLQFWLPYKDKLRPL